MPNIPYQKGSRCLSLCFGYLKADRLGKAQPSPPFHVELEWHPVERILPPRPNNPVYFNQGRP